MFLFVSKSWQKEGQLKTLKSPKRLKDQTKNQYKEITYNCCNATVVKFKKTVIVE